ncbi:hypothetical protein GCM10022251_57270 [Phytohabitans flavus]|uniref:Nudix hydrolase domain-containing protein n=1 Tax=Phytohabitans flavus TaxID=1076124 RepID=A0A6F8XTM2_9ACTN|nr:NUDIX domain-containing protein [Phytohabitans flavus]BCB77184.1 hypothetical protein Pflav_035940 [Phytohabitans flavus]
MTEIRHFSASAIVLDGADRVLLVHDDVLDRWSCPGGHIHSGEDPAHAALREVNEYTGLRVKTISDVVFAHPTATTHTPPYVILETQADDDAVGPHRHLDMVYVCQPIEDVPAGDPAGCEWVSVSDLAALSTSPELPSLVADAARWAKLHR